MKSYSSGKFFNAERKRPPNTIQAVKNTPESKKASSIVCSRVQFRRGFSLQRSSKGVTTTAPTASPSHHVDHIAPYIAQSPNPPKATVLTPTLALTSSLPIPPPITHFKI